jgi:hypothetical protein
LLPVIDSLERALEVVNKEDAQLAPMIEGIELTLKFKLFRLHHRHRLMHFGIKWHASFAHHFYTEFAHATWLHAEWPLTASGDGGGCQSERLISRLNPFHGRAVSSDSIIDIA